MTPVLSNLTNYQFLMKVLMKFTRIKTMFHTVARHATCRPNRTYIRQDVYANIANFSQITQIYRIKDNTRMFHD